MTQPLINIYRNPLSDQRKNKKLQTHFREEKKKIANDSFSSLFPPGPYYICEWANGRMVERHHFYNLIHEI